MESLLYILRESPENEVSEPLAVLLRVDRGYGVGIVLHGFVGVLELLADIVVLQDVDDPDVEHHVVHLVERLAVVLLGDLLRPRRHVHAQLDLNRAKKKGDAQSPKAPTLCVLVQSHICYRSSDRNDPHLAVPGSRRSTSPNPAADDRNRLPLM